MKFVFPGDEIGSAEEFLAGEGVYEENGILFASIAGTVVVESGVVRVEGIKKIPKLEKGDVVIGRVIDLRNNFAMVEIARKKGEDRELTKRNVGILHSSNTASGDIKTSVGYLDVIEAEVLDSSLRLSIKGDVGVVSATCRRCGSKLERHGDMLKCPKCGSIEKRKISPRYGRGEL